MAYDLKPIRDAEEARYAHTERDKAKKEVDAPFPITRLETLVGDCEAQPPWRARADLNCAYYDGKQIDEITAMQYQAEGIDAKPTNLVARIINGVLGQEERNRTDVTVTADDDELADVTEVANSRMKEAQREAFADLAVSNAYASQVKAGIGWVEVQRNSDLLEYPYRVQDIHRNEMWWDWRAKHVLLRDARWMARKNWQDEDILSAAFPRFAQLFKSLCGGWSDLPMLEMAEDSLVANDRIKVNNVLEENWSIQRSFRVRGSEWLDTARRRIKTYEVWYKVPATCTVIIMSPTRRLMYDPANPLHVEAVARGLVKVSKTTTFQLRRALYAGPYRISDVGTTRRNFPYTPFMAFRDDVDETPYGLIDGMRAPQDEYNERRLRIRWLLKARQVLIDNDALDTEYNNYKQVANDVTRPDMVLILRAQRRNLQDGVRVESNFTMQKEQYEAMQDAKQLLQDVPGVYGPQLGNAPAGVTSGVAIGSLVEQGITSMGELNGNYRQARRMVYENMLQLIVDDHSARDLAVMIGSGESRRKIFLNSVDREGNPINQMAEAPIRVGLGEMPSTPAFKMQQQQQIGDIIRSLAGDPAAVALLAPSFIEATDLPDRQNLADELRRAKGQVPAKDKQAQAAAQKKAQEAAERQAKLAEEDAEAEVRGKQAKAVLDQSKAVEIQQRIGITNQQVEGELPDPAANDPEAQMEAATDDAIVEAMQGM